MARKLAAPIFLGVFTILALVLLTGDITDDKDTLRQTFKVEAVYNSGYVEISYLDKSNKTESVVMEILGMEESFQKTFSDSEFIEVVPFLNEPKYGWPIHPIIFEVEHTELGHIQLKTEIHSLGEALPPVIYSRP